MIALSALLALSAGAAEVTQKKAENRDWTDAVKDALTVYNNKDTFVQKVKFAWMEQFQVADVQPAGRNGTHLKPGATPVNQEFRRSWVGLNIDFSSGTKFHTWGRIGGLPYRCTYEDGRKVKHYTYTDLFDIWVSQDIKRVKGLTVKVGKIKPLITTDYSTPSSAIYCVERSIVGNQFGLDSNWGLDVTYAPSKQDKFYVQLFANDRASSDKNMKHTDVYRDGRGLKGEFGWEDKCYGILGASHKFHVTESGFHGLSAQYGHDFNNVRHRGRKGANCYGLNTQDVLSLGYEFKYDKFYLLTNLVACWEANNGTGKNNIGLQLQPMYSVCPHVDLIFRYTGSTGRNSCKLAADRYICTQTIAPSWVDSIHTFYLGADVYVSAKDKNAAKIMFGAEFAHARKAGKSCYDGWEFTTAFRWNF